MGSSSMFLVPSDLLFSGGSSMPRYLVATTQSQQPHGLSNIIGFYPSTLQQQQQQQQPQHQVPLTMPQFMLPQQHQQIMQQPSNMQLSLIQQQMPTLQMALQHQQQQQPNVQMALQHQQQQQPNLQMALQHQQQQQPNLQMALQHQQQQQPNLQLALQHQQQQQQAAPNLQWATLQSLQQSPLSLSSATQQVQLQQQMLPSFGLQMSAPQHFLSNSIQVGGSEQYSSHDMDMQMMMFENSSSIPPLQTLTTTSQSKQDPDGVTLSEMHAWPNIMIDTNADSHMDSTSTVTDRALTTTVSDPSSLSPAASPKSS
jgi:hypothetical protein